jgi:transposase
LTGRGRPWIRRQCRPPGERKDRPQPDGQRKTGLEASPCGRRSGHPACRNVHGGQRSRLDDARGTGRPIRPIRGPRGKPRRPRKRPKKLHADKAYDDFRRCREALRERGIRTRIGRRGVDSSERLGKYRWTVERTLSWLNRFRRLKVRYERRADVHQAFLELSCALICWNRVQRYFRRGTW